MRIDGSLGGAKGSARMVRRSPRVRRRASLVARVSLTRRRRVVINFLAVDQERVGSSLRRVAESVRPARGSGMTWVGSGTVPVSLRARDGPEAEGAVGAGGEDGLGGRRKHGAGHAFGVGVDVVEELAGRDFVEEDLAGGIDGDDGGSIGRLVE